MLAAIGGPYCCGVLLSGEPANYIHRHVQMGDLSNDIGSRNVRLKYSEILISMNNIELSKYRRYDSDMYIIFSASSPVHLIMRYPKPLKFRGRLEIKSNYIKMIVETVVNVESGLSIRPVYVFPLCEAMVLALDYQPAFEANDTGAARVGQSTGLSHS